jgi:long-chain fatty acid transport protein
MKKILISGVSLFGLGASMATAGGMEVGRFSPGFMFEGGNYAEMSITQTTPKVTDDTFAPNKSMLAKMTNTSLSVKMAVNDRLSFGLQHYDAAKIDLTYQGAGGPFTSSPDPYATQVAVAQAAAAGDAATQAAIGAYAATAMAAGATNATEIAAYAIANDTATQAAIATYYAGLSSTDIGVILATKYGGAANIPLSTEPFVDLSFKSTVFVANYAVSDRVDVFGGIKYSAGSATGNVLINPHGDLDASEGTATSPVVGVSYSIPDIALRVTATYQGKASTTHKTTRTYNGATETLEKTKAALPESFTLDFQTGIAADTLVFGSIHRAKWGDAHIYFDGASEPKTTWSDSTTYSLGVGRKINENWAVSASLNYEEGTEAAGTSLLSTTNGVRGVTLGARYTMDKMTFSVGVNYSEFGNKTVTAAPLGVGEFKNNSMTSVGVKVGFQF